MKTLTIKKIGTAAVIVDIIPKGNPEVRPAYPMNPTHVTIHNTGNDGKGANAKAHNIYIHNQASLPVAKTGYASWHFSVDDKFIYQHIPLDETAWHTGDGSGSKSGNMTSIGIEICENPETDTKKAEENAIALTVYLMKMFGIPVKNVVPHQHWSGKYCPRVILKRDGGFEKFSKRIANAYNAKPKVEAPKEKDVLNMKMKEVPNVNHKALADVYTDARKAGLLTSDKWEKLAKTGDITIGEVAYLATILDQRRHTNK